MVLYHSCHIYGTDHRGNGPFETPYKDFKLGIGGG